MKSNKLAHCRKQERMEMSIKKWERQEANGKSKFVQAMSNNISKMDMIVHVNSMQALCLLVSPVWMCCCHTERWTSRSTWQPFHCSNQHAQIYHLNSKTACLSKARQSSYKKEKLKDHFNKTIQRCPTRNLNNSGNSSGTSKK